MIEGATLRRSRTGVRSVSFPRNKKGYPYIWLRTLPARQGLERRVFEKLAIPPSHSTANVTLRSGKRRP